MVPIPPTFAFNADNLRTSQTRHTSNDVITELGNIPQHQVIYTVTSELPRLDLLQMLLLPNSEISPNTRLSTQ